MGIPCSKKKHQRNRMRTDSSNLNSSAEIDELLTFKVEMGNIKARNLPAASSYIRIKFGPQHEFRTAIMTSNSQNYSWRFHKEFDYSTTRRVLREQAIVLSLMDRQDKEIGTISINLYDIATGPSHQDFVIKMKKGRIDPGRLSFDVKMSQIINLTVRAQSIHCKLTSSLREKFYNFSLKMTVKEREFFSDHSSNFKNLQMFASIGEKHADELGEENYQMHMDENKKVKMRYFNTKTKKNLQKTRTDDKGEPETSETSKLDDDSIIQVVKEKRPAVSRGGSQKISSTPTPSHAAAPKKDISWVYGDHDETAPLLEMSVNLRELASGSFQFFLWANKDGLNKSISEDDLSDMSGDEVYIDHKLVGDCFIGMNNFFFGDAEINYGENSSRPAIAKGSEQSLPSKSYQKRLVRLTEKLLYHGDHEGELVAEFVVENSPFYKQMIFGVRTEEGIQRSSSLYLNAEKQFLASFKNTNVKEIKTLRQHKEALKNITFNLYGPKINPRTRIKLIDELATNILKVLEILKTSHQESLISVLYKTPENLLASQKVFIGLAKHALDNCDEVPNSLKPIYFETLLMLIHRAEFELNYMGFDQSYKDFLKNAQKASFKNDIGGPKIDLKNIQQKLKVCENYQSFLYKALQKVITKLNQRGLPDKEREFVEQFSAIAYFRIPEFRQKLLECLKKDIEHTKIPEWRGNEWYLDERVDISGKNQHLTSLFDWEGDFYVYLKNTEEGENNYKLLNEILEDKDWQNRLSKRGVAFHSFLNEWAKHVNKTVVTKDHMPWQDLPGYSILIKSFLVELKAKDVKRYPQTLLNVSYSLLKNEKLLNIFIAIVYGKTRLYESANVFATFELINNWLAVLKENKKAIPATFDYSYFLKGICMVIEGDHALNLAKALWVIYNNFNLFPVNEKQHLSEFLFGDVFFKLFLHWSWNVRQVFHHLLIYRFYHQHRTTNTNLTNLDDLKKELLLYNQRREYFKRDKKVLINDFINMEYSRHMTIIENAYKKFKEGRNQRGNRPRALTKVVVQKTKEETIRSSDLPENTASQTLLKNSPTLQDFDSGRKEEFFPKLKLQSSNSERERPESGSVVDDFFDMPEKVSRKQSVPQNGDSSYWFINPDALELSIQGPMTKISRSESFNLTPTHRMDMDFNKPEGLNMLEIEAAKKNFEEIDSLKMTDSSSKKLVPSVPEDAKKSREKKVILRRWMYFDRQTNKLKEIPKEYTVYLEYAYKEYEVTKEQYVKWYNDFQQTLSKLSEEQAKKLKADPKVPELNVKIPLDDGEEGQIDLDDW